MGQAGPKERFFMSKKSFIKKGKKSRNELFLPSLRYVVADNWIDTLGPIAFTSWLKLHSWVDRRDEYREYDKVPYTLEDTAKKLGMSKAKLYRTVIVPLWEHELIDLVEYEESKRKTQKPKNIIVYESPRNEHQTEIQPLVKTRDWKKDYGSASQIHGRKGGRPKKPTDIFTTYRFKNKTVRLYRFKNETVYRFKNKTVTVSKIKPSNVFNNLLINTNKSSNVSNNHHLISQEKTPSNQVSQNGKPEKKHDDDDQYKQLRNLFLNAKAADIKNHDKHYPRFRNIIEKKIGFEKLILSAEAYIEQEKETAQIAWFLGGGFYNYLDKPKPKKSNQQPNSELPEAVSEQATAVEEAGEDWEEKQKKLNAKLAAWEAKKQAKMGVFRLPFNSN